MPIQCEPLKFRSWPAACDSCSEIAATAVITAGYVELLLCNSCMAELRNAIAEWGMVDEPKPDVQ